VPSWAWTLPYLLLIAAQLAFFAPEVAAGRSIDAGIYRVDGLGLVFGMAWCLGAALAAWPLGLRLTLGQLALGLMTVGALNMAYAREPLVLIVAWELMGICLWLLVRHRSGQRVRWLATAIHLPALPLLVAMLLGLVPPFAPPFAGEGEPWHAAVAAMLAVVVLLRSAIWPFSGWADPARESASHALALYSLAAPLLLAKALVAAPWDALGVWLVTLLATLALIGGVVVQALRTGEGEGWGYFSIVVPAIVAGLGLAPLTPHAALGALALMLPALAFAPTLQRGPGIALLLTSVPGIWLLTQAALRTEYTLVGALLLPALAWVALRSGWSLGRAGWGVLGVAALIAAVPQASLWAALRPGVGAMAGGVGAPGEVLLDPALGLRVDAAGGVLLSALPATGILAAVFVAWALLDYARRIALRTVERRRKERGAA
jgi:hypothetical protein